MYANDKETNIKTRVCVPLHNMNNIPDKIIGQRILYNLGMTRLIEQDLNLFNTPEAN